MVEQCICNRIQAVEMVLEWVAYSTTKNGLKLTTDTLEHFDHEVPALLIPLLWTCMSTNRQTLFSLMMSSFSLKVLSKKNKSKKSLRKEETHNRTRDVHSLQDLYPLQWALVLFSFCMSLLSWLDRISIVSQSLTSFDQNQSWGGGGGSTGCVLYSCQGKLSLLTSVILLRSTFLKPSEVVARRWPCVRV